MKTALECLPCYLRQTLQVARLSTDDEAVQLRAMHRVAELTRTMDMEQTPPENSVAVYQEIARITGCDDPYLEIKRQSNEQALLVLPQLRQKVKESENPLLLSLRLAIGGNIIDYGAMHSFDVDAAMQNCLDAPLLLDDSMELISHIQNLKKGANVLYLADNSGEIVYDSLLVEVLNGYGFTVTVAVKSGAIINDALMADARMCGLDSIAVILENGTNCPGTPLALCSDELKHHFYNADLIISKGQGNFETLSEAEAEIFFLLTIKCSVVGTHLVDIAGRTDVQLPGNGELVLFHSQSREKYGKTNSASAAG